MFTLSLRLSAADFKFIPLDVPGASTTVPKGINALGDVVGLTVDSDGNGHGFLFHQGKFKIIDVPDSSFTNAVGINAHGDIVGRFSDLDGNNHGYLLSGGHLKAFDVKGCDTDTTPHGVNNVGDIEDAASMLPATPTASCWLEERSPSLISRARYQQTRTSLPMKTTSSVSTVTRTTRAQDIFARPRVTFGASLFLGAPNVGARGINEREDIVGQFDGVSDGLTHGFLLSNGSYVRIDFPRASSTVVSDINNHKIVVGDYFDADGNDHGFVALGVLMRRTIGTRPPRGNFVSGNYF